MRLQESRGRPDRRWAPLLAGAALLLAFVPVALANYTLSDGTTVIYDGGSGANAKYTVVYANGTTATFTQNQGTYDRGTGHWEPPTSALSQAEQQSYNSMNQYQESTSSSATYNKYWGVVPIYQNGQQVGWGTLYDNSKSSLGEVFQQGQWINSGGQYSWSGVCGQVSGGLACGGIVSTTSGGGSSSGGSSYGSTGGYSYTPPPPPPQPWTSVSYRTVTSDGAPQASGCTPLSTQAKSSQATWNYTVESTGPLSWNILATPTTTTTWVATGTETVTTPVTTTTYEDVTTHYPNGTTSTSSTPVSSSTTYQTTTKTCVAGGGSGTTTTTSSGTPVTAATVKAVTILKPLNGPDYQAPQGSGACNVSYVPALNGQWVNETVQVYGPYQTTQYVTQYQQEIVPETVTSYVTRYEPVTTYETQQVYHPGYTTTVPVYHPGYTTYWTWAGVQFPIYHQGYTTYETEYVPGYWTTETVPVTTMQAVTVPVTQTVYVSEQVPIQVPETVTLTGWHSAEAAVWQPVGSASDVELALENVVSGCSTP